MNSGNSTGNWLIHLWSSIVSNKLNIVLQDLKFFLFKAKFD